MWCRQNEQLRLLRPSFHEWTYVINLLGGVEIFDSDSRIQVLSIKQPVQVHTVSSGDMSHGRTSAFYENLDHRIIFFKNEMRCSLSGAVRVGLEHGISPNYKL